MCDEAAEFVDTRQWTRIANTAILRETEKGRCGKMVVVRESPHAKLSPDKKNTAWPPRSPFQALLSSPSGRRKWQDRRLRRGDGDDDEDYDRDVSPSPIKRKTVGSTEALSVLSEDEEGRGEEDEETLELRLLEIQAKLKLKKLRKKKSADGSERGGEENDSRGEDSLSASPRKSRPRPLSRLPHNHDDADVQFPLSPTGKDAGLLPKEQLSPARKRLGLGQSLKADGVSLKRARDGMQLQQSSESRLSNRRNRDVVGVGRTVTFSERLERSKIESQERVERQERVEKARSRGFGGMLTSDPDAPRSSALGGRAPPSSNFDLKRPSSAYQLHAKDVKLEGGSTISRSASTRSSQRERSRKPRATRLFISPPQSQTTRTTDAAATDSDTSMTSGRHQQDQEPTSPPSCFDPFSELHLSKRHIPHADVTRAMEGKEIYLLPRLLKEVKAPHYEPPDCENDFVIFTLLASKSSPFDQKAAHRTSDENQPQEDAEKPRNKFMVLHLTDLEWEVDCFLFGSAFDALWKLTPGTLLAILNPGIMPPKGNQNSGRFSLKLGSSEDCVMEVGVARDLGYCVSVKKDGQVCGAWVDKRKTEICEFHLNLMIERERKHRMEVNTMWRGGKKGGEDFRPKGHNREAGGFNDRISGNQKGQGKYHREYGQLYSVPSGSTKSAASLLDAEDMDALHNMSAEEASRKRIASAQRERDLAKRLGDMGSGVGAEYLRAKQASIPATTVRSTGSQEGKAHFFDKPSAAELGLLGKKAGDQHLSPAKDRKRRFGSAAVSSAGPEAMGWGGARKAGLLQPKEKERRPGSPERGRTRLEGGGVARPGIVRLRFEDGGTGGNFSPTKKRARFALERGIREPGRESLPAGGAALLGGDEEDDDDDDGLDIV